MDMNVSRDDLYKYFFHELGDQRVENWPLLKDASYVTMIIGLYLSSVIFFLPNYMKDRKPFNIKAIMQIYNLFQIAINIILTYLILLSWKSKLTLGCQPVDKSNKPESIKMAKLIWWTLILKIFDMVETMFFILRKKYTQVSVLHVYHHSSNVFFAWVLAKYFPGGMIALGIIINNLVHVLMYTYYYLSAMNEEMQKKIIPWKSKLTTIQMVQFIIVGVHASQALSNNCNVHNIFPSLVIFDMIVLITLFGNFYRKQYFKKNKLKQFL